MCKVCFSGFKHKFVIFGLIMLCSAGARAEPKTQNLFAFTFENDFFVGDDAGYTNGMGITFGQGVFNDFNADNLPRWIYWLTKDTYISTMNNKRRGIAHMFFHRMQTPEDISTQELLVDDVPYAGLLAWQGTLYAWDAQVADQFSLYLGVVGPIAYAEKSQTFIHRLLSSEEPKGWDHQIGNEFVFKVEAQRIWKLYRSNDENNQIDIIGLYGAGIGNLQSVTKAGFAIRWGTNLQHSFSTFSLDADRRANSLSFSSGNDFYLFFGGKVGLVFNSILIEGNTFKDSHSAPLEHFQNQLSTGAAWNIGKNSFVFQLSSTSSSTEFTDKRDTFGAVSFSHGY